MVLARAWRRRLFGAVGAATLAPGLLIVALAGLAMAGGFASLSALSQTFSGPPAPAAQPFSPALLHGLKAPLPAGPAVSQQLGSAAGTVDQVLPSGAGKAVSPVGSGTAASP